MLGNFSTKDAVEVLHVHVFRYINTMRDKELAYDVVERNPKTGTHQTRRIHNLGPTGLITTSTRSLQHQLGTRMLEISISDDVAQTRQVMRAQAAAVDAE